MKKYNLKDELKLNKSLSSKIAILLIRGERNKYIKYIVKPFRILILNFMFNTEIPSSVSIGNLLRLPHPFNIIIHTQSKLGIGCTVYHNVTIGANDLSTNYAFPIIGDYCFIGTGSSIIEKIDIGNNVVVVGANSLVTQTIKENSFVSLSKTVNNRIDIKTFIERLL